MEERDFIFTVYARVYYTGIVTATNEEEAKEKCFNNGDFQIIDECPCEIDWDTIEIEED